MSDYKVYTLPVPSEDNIKAVESLILELQRKYREGSKLDDVELTWLDQANNWLDSTLMSN